MNRRERRTAKGRAGAIAPAASGDAEALFRAGIGRQRAGRPAEALALYQRVLAIRPDEPEVLHLAGVAAYEQGQFEAAAGWIGRAAARMPGRPELHNNLGNALQKLGRAAEAEAAFREAIRLAPGYADAHYNLGNLLKETGRPAEAVDEYGRSLTTQPNDPQTHNNLGIALRALGRRKEAETAFGRTLGLKPRHVGAWLNLCDIMASSGRADAALARCEQALAADSGNFAAMLGRGLMQFKLCDPRRAAQSFRRVLSIDPSNAIAREKLAYASMAAGNADEAIAVLQAEPCRGNPAFDVILGDALSQQQDFDDAVAHYRRALASDPDHAAAGLLKALEAICAWEEIPSLLSRVMRASEDAVARGERPFQSPLDALARSLDPAYGLQIAQAWSRDLAGLLKPFSLAWGRHERGEGDGRITVGYLSSDFRNHAVGHLISGLFAHHDRQRFRVVAYSTGPDDGSAYRQQVAAGCDSLVDLGTLDAGQAVQRIRADGVDILVDLNGHTTGHRLDVLALRPAPIQVTYLGFPGTSGAEFIDYVVADPVVAPADHAPYFTEKIVHLPHTYQANSAQPIAADRPTRRECGLPESAFVFASFCANFKIEPLMFGVWMDILASIDTGVLWLYRGNGTAEKNLRREAAVRGVDPDRLVFGGRVAKDRHLARLGLADLGLDTRIYGGHTTTSDMLWAGVPVISLLGGHFASRVGASLLRATGLDDLVVTSPEDYRDLAIRLAADPAKLAAVRTRLADGRKRSPLFDTARFAGNLERAYARMWERHVAGLPPAAVAVAED